MFKYRLTQDSVNLLNINQMKTNFTKSILDELQAKKSSKLLKKMGGHSFPTFSD